MYVARNNEVFNGPDADAWKAMTFESAEVANKAVEMLNKADALNNARKYTASARMHAQVECLPGYVDCSTDD